MELTARAYGISAKMKTRSFSLDTHFVHRVAMRVGVGEPRVTDLKTLAARWAAWYSWTSTACAARSSRYTSLSSRTRSSDCERKRHELDRTVGVG